MLGERGCVWGRECWVVKRPILLTILSGLLALGSVPFLWIYGAYRWALWRGEHPLGDTASSLAIIGGADGPTAIWVSVPLRMEGYLLLGAVLLAGAAGLFLLGGRIGKKQGL